MTSARESKTQPADLAVCAEVWFIRPIDNPSPDTTLAFAEYPSQLRFFEQPMWLAQLNAVLWGKPFIIPVLMICGLAYLRQTFVR